MTITRQNKATLTVAHCPTLDVRCCTVLYATYVKRPVRWGACEQDVLKWGATQQDNNKVLVTEAPPSVHREYT
jgi:hypothetical protein